MYIPRNVILSINRWYVKFEMCNELNISVMKTINFVLCAYDSYIDKYRLLFRIYRYCIGEWKSVVFFSYLYEKILINSKTLIKTDL